MTILTYICERIGWWQGRRCQDVASLARVPGSFQSFEAVPGVERVTPAEYRTHERAREDIFQRRDRRAHLLLRVLLAVHGRGDFQSGRARPRRIAARGVRDERGGRPSKRALRDDRARLSAKSSRRRRRAGTARRDDDGRRSRGRRGPGRATRGERACRDGDADARDGGHVIRAGEGEAPAAD
eukprot:30957-Pelagococcus_subviridis.AAC.46